MHLNKRLFAATSAVVLTAPLAALTTPPATGAAQQPGERAAAESAQVVLDWERIVFQTVYPAPPVTVPPTPGPPIPTRVPVLGFTSGAMYDAVLKSMHHEDSSETAAVARAAHDVLVHYFPESSAALAAYLATTLASVTDPDERATGASLGAEAAREMLASRVGDGFNDPDIHYTLPPGVGIWQPVAPATDMLGAWLGSLDFMVLQRPIQINGPDLLTTGAYAKDYREVKRLGGDDASGHARTQAQTDTANFFNFNSATMVGDAAIRYLESPAGAQELSLHRTALLFARMHTAMTDSVIQAWQLKRDVGFWRPNEAITGAALDGNPRTAPQAGWAPLLPNPPYSDYISGHASLTAPAVAVIRRMLGETVPLELINSSSSTHRTYPTLTDLERDAFRSRIWGGLHFRDAMVDGYRIGHRTARRVMAVVD